MASFAGGPPPLSCSDFPPLSSSSPLQTSKSPLDSTKITSLPLLSPDSTSNTPSTKPSPPVLSQISSSTHSLWKDLFKRNSDLLKNYPSPTFTSEGVPIVRAPASILLKSSEVWKDHLICHFFGTPPPLRKIFYDLNPIWGKKGQIKVHYYSPRACLIFIPNSEFREWVLDVGFWSAGMVSFVVSLWSPSSSLSEQTLSSAPVWLTLHDVPPQLRSEEGLAVVASGVGIPLPQSKSNGPPQPSFSAPKLRVVVRLDNGPLPSKVIVQDDEGTQVSIGIEYLNLPPLCPSCNSFGHKVHRCSLSIRNPLKAASRISAKLPSAPPCLSSAAAVSTPSSSSLPVDLGGFPSQAAEALGLLSFPGPASSNLSKPTFDPVLSPPTHSLISNPSPPVLTHKPLNSQPIPISSTSPSPPAHLSSKPIPKNPSSSKPLSKPILQPIPPFRPSPSLGPNPSPNLGETLAHPKTHLHFLAHPTPQGLVPLSSLSDLPPSPAGQAKSSSSAAILVSPATSLPPAFSPPVRSPSSPKSGPLLLNRDGYFPSSVKGSSVTAVSTVASAVPSPSVVPQPQPPCAGVSRKSKKKSGKKKKQQVKSEKILLPVIHREALSDLEAGEDPSSSPESEFGFQQSDSFLDEEAFWIVKQSRQSRKEKRKELYQKAIISSPISPS